MTTFAAAVFVVLGLVIIGLCNALIRRNNEVEAALDELYLWRTHCDATDRWLAEFPEVTEALAYLKAKAQGEGGTDMVHMRELMRCRRFGTRMTSPAPQWAGVDRASGPDDCVVSIHPIGEPAQYIRVTEPGKPMPYGTSNPPQE